MSARGRERSTLAHEFARWARSVLPVSKCHLGSGDSDGIRQRFNVVGAVVASPVEEEGRSARNTTEIGAVDVLSDPGRADVVVQVGSETRDVEAELVCV